MPDAAWKAWERTVARWFGGQRRGASTRGKSGGLTDVICPGFAIEAKLLSRPSYSDLLAACLQAERNGEPGALPVAVVKRKNQRTVDALCVIRLDVFSQWFLTHEDRPGEEISIEED